MATTSITIRMDEKLKKQAETLFEDMGLNMTTAFTIFAKKVSREKRIPFDVSIDPFYSESNMRYLEDIACDIAQGQAHFSEHELIGEDES